MRVLLVLSDALRADHLSCYGYGRPTSPGLDALAARGARFSSFFAPNIPTEPAHTSIFTGLHGPRHGVLAHKEPLASPRAGSPWLPGLLKDSGIRTAAFDTLADSKAFFAQGYTEYRNLRHARSLLTAADINAELVPWIERHPTGPWFCFVHYWDTHSPYLPPQSYRSRHYEGDPNSVAHDDLARWRAQPSYPFAYRWQVRHYGAFRDLDYVRGLYDAEISYLDDQLAPVLTALEGGDDDYVVIFTADHGEVMDDRPGFFDHAGLYDDTVRVPLIMAGAGLPPGTVVQGMYQHLDLAPTILSLFGRPVPAEMTGADLAAVAAAAPEAPGYEALYLSEGTWEVKWGVRTKAWKLIKVIDPGVHGAKEDELFDMVADPAESTNVASAYPEVADRLELVLRRAWEELLAGEPDPLWQQTTRGVPAQGWLDRARQQQSDAEA